MSHLRVAILLVLFLVGIEAGVTLWRNTGMAPSTAPIFSYPPGAAHFGASATLAPAIEMFRADRAAECKLTAADQARLTVLYFEWDQLKISPVMSLAMHAPEVCNESAGYKLLEVMANRNYQVPGHEPLAFDCTHFADPSGRDVFIFKVVWLQGYGCLRMRDNGPGAAPLVEGEQRLTRIKNSFVRHSGAARIVEAAVYEAHDAEHAWQTFRESVLDQLVWTGLKPERGASVSELGENR